MKVLPMALAAVLVAATGATAHDRGNKPETFAAGMPGDTAEVARTVDLTIHEQPDGKMSFGSDGLQAKHGEQIRFVVTNDGKAPHEFRIDSQAGNAAHKAMMAKMPGMEHHDANAVTIAPGKTATLVWRFSKPGTYEFACLLPGHYEAGMHGAIIVAR